MHGSITRIRPSVIFKRTINGSRIIISKMITEFIINVSTKIVCNVPFFSYFGNVWYYGLDSYNT